MVYFSYTILTTLGYGDILPRSAWAQVLAAVEAMLGPFHIAGISGRLVGRVRLRESRSNLTNPQPFT